MNMLIAASGVRFQKKEPVSNVRSDHRDAFDGRDDAENLSKTSTIYLNCSRK